MPRLSLLLALAALSCCAHGRTLRQMQLPSAFGAELPTPATSTVAPTTTQLPAALSTSFPSTAMLPSNIQQQLQQLLPSNLPDLTSLLPSTTNPAATPSAPTTSFGTRRPTAPSGTTPAPSKASPSATNGSSTASGGGCPDAQAALDAHNAARALTGAAPLAWDSQLTGVAQAYADRCVFQHSGGAYGENLAMGTSTCADGVRMWIAEGPGGLNHYSQVVWKGTTRVGCGYAASCQMLVCNYSPAGNVVGQEVANV